MGYTKHHCIIIVGSLDDLHEIRKCAKGVFADDMVSEILDSPTNCVKSLFIAPDGGNEGWDSSNEYDRIRSNFLEHIAGIYTATIAEVELPECGKYVARKVR